MAIEYNSFGLRYRPDGTLAQRRHTRRYTELFTDRKGVTRAAGSGLSGIASSGSASCEASPEVKNSIAGSAGFPCRCVGRRSRAAVA